MLNRDGTSNSITLLSHRAAANTEVRKLMQNKRNWNSDSTAFSLIVTAIAEYRAKESVLARLHLAATIDLLGSRGGLKSIQSMKFSTGMGIFNALVNIELSLYPTIGDLRAALEACRMTLEMVQLSRPCFKLNPPLRPYFGTECRGQLGAQLAILYAVSCLLMMADNAAPFLSNFEQTVHNSEGSKLLSPLAALFTLCSCAVRAGYWCTAATTPLRSWEAIEFVALMDLAPQGRPHVIEMLSCKLTGSDVPKIMSNDFLATVEDEIVTNWSMQNMKGHK